MPDVVPIWPDGAPGSQDWSHAEQEYVFSEPWTHRVIRNVTQPTLTVFLPDRATGTAVIVCPGGAHHFLAFDHEGIDVARWLNKQGIAAFVLKYRVIKTPERDDDFLQARALIGTAGVKQTMRRHAPLAIADGRQAVTVARRRAAEWGLAPDRVGILGFSAGGHVAAGVALDHDAASRPDFVAPIYGALWEDVVVPTDAPPLFTALANDDAIAVEPCVRLYSAWQAAGHPAELHIYAQGGHGFGMHKQGLPVDGWIERLSDWMAVQGLLG